LDYAAEHQGSAAPLFRERPAPAASAHWRCGYRNKRDAHLACDRTASDRAFFQLWVFQHNVIMGMEVRFYTGGERC